MFQLKRIICLYVVLAVLASAVSATAATYYVATTGNDTSNPGTIDQPFRTVQRGVNAAVNPGDTVYLRGGTYLQGDPALGTSQILIQHSGAAGNPITLTNYPREKVIIRYINTGSFARIAFSAIGGDTVPIGYYVIQGLELDNCGINFFSAHDVVIRNNYFHDTGIHISGTGFRNIIDQNIMAKSQSHGMYLVGTYNVISNNLVYGSGVSKPNAGYGLQGAGYPVGQYKLAGPEYATWQNNIVANNTFAYNALAGIVNWQPDAKNNTYENNIFYENGVLVSNSGASQGIQWQSSGNGNLVRNNLFYATLPGSTLDFIGGIAGITYIETGSVHGDPLFVNGPTTMPALPDFRLQRGSPAIDKGIPTVTTQDLMGTTRPQGAAYDIGAYEVAVGSADTTPPAPPQNVAVR